MRKNGAKESGRLSFNLFFSSLIFHFLFDELMQMIRFTQKKRKSHQAIRSRLINTEADVTWSQ